METETRVKFKHIAKEETLGLKNRLLRFPVLMWLCKLTCFPSSGNQKHQEK
jgi:hypothetical protein